MQVNRLRQKDDEKESLKVGDIVLVGETNVPKYRWRLGKITQTFPDREGRVRKVELIGILYDDPITEKSKAKAYVRATRNLAKLPLQPTPDVVRFL